MAASCQQPLRRTCLVALIGLASIANATRPPGSQALGKTTHRSGVPVVPGPSVVRLGMLAIFGGVTVDAPQRFRSVHAAVHDQATTNRRVVGATGTDPTMAEVKAGFLISFTKFTEWPTEVLPPAAPLVLCISRSSTVQKALEDRMKGLAIQQHPLVVRGVKLEGPFDACHVLYVEDLDSKRALELFAQLNGASVLSVSDLKNFAQLGGGVQLFIEDGRMRFAVNLDATRRIRLRLSALFLSLAKIVKDDPKLHQR